MSTIFAPITNDLKAAVSIIRISGPNATKIFDIFSINQKITARFVSYVDLKYQGKLIDKSLLTYFKAPNSFTGEDIVELNIHGSIFILNKILSILSNQEGFYYAKNGEFTKRAFLNNKLDLLQAEAINDLVNSTTELQKNQALNQLKGEISVIYDSWRDNLIEIIAILEAYIDFPDDDIDPKLVKDINQKIFNFISSITEFLESNKNGEKITNGFKVAIIGKINAGKSSLLNELAGRDIAITSDIAGTTRDVIDVHLDLNGIPIILSDTAGIREASDEIEKIGIERAKFTAKNADLRILILDSSKPIDLTDIKNYNLRETDLIVANKIDKIFDENKSIIKQQKFIEISVKEKKAVNQLINHISNKLKNSYQINNYAISKQRHLDEINNILKYLTKFSLDDDLILAVENLRLAANAIGKITGKLDVEEILDKIFQKFCIGK